MKILNIAVVLVSIMLNACAMLPPLDEAKSQLASSKPCCNSLSEIKYADLKVGAEIDITLDSKSPAYQFDTGKSFFAAYKLPRFDKESVLTVKSHFGGDVFYPTVTMLDKEYQITRIVTKPDVKYIPPGWVEGGRIEGVITFSPETNEVYATIHTTDALIGGSMTTKESGYTTYIAGSYMYVPGGTHVHRYSTVGNMKISLKQAE